MRVLINLLIVVALISANIQAADYRSNQTVYITERDTLESDLFAGAETVTISGVLLSDVFAGCKHLDVKGEVVDDVIAGCQSLRIGGKVGDQVIGFAQNIKIDGEVGGDVLAYAEEVWITNNAHIKGNLHIGTANLHFEGGIVEGKIFGGARKAYLNGKVNNNVDLSLHEVEFGNAYFSAGGTKLKLHTKIADDAEYIPENLEISYFKTKYFFQGWFFYWSVISMLIVGILLVTIFKNFSLDIVSYAKKNLWQNTGVGLLVFVVVPIAMVILAVLVITIPVSLILLAIFLVILYLSSIITGLVLGDYVLNYIKKNGHSKSLIWSLIIGILLIALIAEIPAIGWLFSLLFICFGIGTLVLFTYQSLKIDKRAV